MKELLIEKTKDLSLFNVVEKTTKFGERISAYESKPDEVSYKHVFLGSIADCYAYVKVFGD